MLCSLLLVMAKSNVAKVYSAKYTKNKMNSDDDLPLEKTLNMQNVVILIKLVFQKSHNHYYYEIFLEKCSHK